MNYFWIQTSNPEIRMDYDPEDESISYVMETIFPSWTEKLYIIWHTLHIPLCYKYDLSIIIDDILDILEQIQSKENGVLINHWPSNTFASTWRMEWNINTLKIESDWTCVLGHIENLLNEKNILIVEKNHFLYEWKSVLEVVINSIKKSSYNERDIKDFDRLMAIYLKIEQKGILYRKKSSELDY